MKWVTGGTEALHQLVDAVNRMGGSAFIVYYDQFSKIRSSYVPLKFKHYKIKSTILVEDSELNAVVIPEAKHELLDTFINCNKHLWWLGWYHFSGNISEIKSDVTHLYQSEYLRLKLIKNGVDKIKSLSDYISLPFYKNRWNRKDVVAIPSRKIASEYEHLHKKITETYEVREIKNWSLLKLRRELSKSKVYIDLGIHAGKDRMPREATFFNNIIYTSTLGTCTNEYDIPIDERYKIASSKNWIEVKRLIDNSLSSYKEEFNDFEKYQNEIASQKQKFFGEVAALFGCTMKTSSHRQTKKFILYNFLETILIPFGLYQYQFPYKPFIKNKIAEKLRIKLLDFIQVILK